MASLNKVQLIGRIGRNPEARFTQGGQAVANFTLATDESYKGNNGEKQKKTEWHNIVAWGQVVESYIQPYLKTGDLVYVEGKLQTRKWEDKRDGATKYTTEIVVSNIQGIMSSNNGNGNQTEAAAQRQQRPAQQASPAQSQSQQSRAAIQQAQPQEISDEDIPF